MKKDDKQIYNRFSNAKLQSSKSGLIFYGIPLDRKHYTYI